MVEPKYRLYSTVLCFSGRESLATIDGREVAVIGYRNTESAGYVYTVAVDAKSPSTFECFERELRPIDQRQSLDRDDPYWVIRNMLGCYLHQDFDVQYDSIADAIHAAVRRTDRTKLLVAIEKLEQESDQLISDVLGDHDVPIWDATTPREMLTTIKTLAKLS